MSIPVFNIQNLSRVWNFTCDVGREVKNYAVQHKAISILSFGTVPLLMGLKNRIFTHTPKPEGDTARIDAAARPVLNPEAAVEAVEAAEAAEAEVVPEKAHKNVSFNEVVETRKYVKESDPKTYKDTSKSELKLDGQIGKVAIKEEAEREALLEKSILESVNEGVGFKYLGTTKDVFIRVLTKYSDQITKLNLEGNIPNAALVRTVASCPNLTLDLGALISQLDETEKSKLVDNNLSADAKKRIRGALVPELNKGMPFSYLRLRIESEYDQFISEHGKDIKELNLSGKFKSFPVFVYEGLSKCENLTTLNLDGSDVHWVWDSFIEAIGGLQHLENLDLSNCILGRRGILAEAKYPKSLKKITLRNNGIGFEEALAIIKSDNLEKCTNLDLADNEFRYEFEKHKELRNAANLRNLELAL